MASSQEKVLFPFTEQMEDGKVWGLKHIPWTWRILVIYLQRNTEQNCHSSFELIGTQVRSLVRKGTEVVTV